jgi:hypothetical protein
MIFRYLISLLIVNASFTSASFTNAREIDPLDEINMPSPEFIVLLDDHVRTTCKGLIDLWHERGHKCTDEYVAQLLDPALHELDYETVLLAMHACIATECKTRTPQEQTLRVRIQQMYDQLLDEYDQLVAQTSTRRIKCKHFCTVTTRDLVVNNNACITKLIVKDALTINNLNGAVIANNGRITTGMLPADSIPDDAITNAKMADNAITSAEIAPLTITPDDTAFNPVVAADTNGEAKPLRVYRGSITGATGAVTSGTGFTVTRTGAGSYTVNITAQAYTSAGTYQVFVQLLTEGNAVTIAHVSGSQFTINTVADENFSLFTIGS